ncbi:MAG: hypothetical protein C0592_09125 [Marinilabiliales bacterium]|nr:MAG: hypothetical protein C0592_09125 [Marinilabiliales bacterium]
MKLHLKFSASKHKSDAGCTKSTTHTHRKSRFFSGSKFLKFLSVFLFTSLLMGGGIVQGQQTCQTAVPIFQTNNNDTINLPAGYDTTWYSFSANNVISQIAFGIVPSLPIADSILINLYSGTCSSPVLQQTYEINDSIFADDLDSTQIYFLEVVKNIADPIGLVFKLSGYCPPSQYFQFTPESRTYCCGEPVTLHLTGNSGLPNGFLGKDGCVGLYYTTTPCSQQLYCGTWTVIDKFHLFFNGNTTKTVTFIPDCDPNQLETQIYLRWIWFDYFPDWVDTYQEYVDYCSSWAPNPCYSSCRFNDCIGITLRNPQISITANPNPVCIGECSTLTGSGGVSYSWSTGETDNPISVCPQTPTTYYVTGTDAYGCVGTAQKYVNVELPRPYFTYSEKVCVNDIAEFFGDASCIQSVATWFWQFGDGTTGYGQNPTHIYQTSGYFHVTLTITDIAGNQDQVMHIIYIEPLPDKPEISGIFNDCDGNILEYTITNYDPGLEYKWSIPLGSGVFTSNNQNVIYSNSPSEKINWISVPHPQEILITATGKNGCGNSNTYYFYPCCGHNLDNHFTNEIITLSSTPTQGTVFYIDGDCEFAGDYTFDGCTFLLGGAARIVIPDNNELTFTNSTLQSCREFMWDGIYLIDDDSKVIIENNSHVQDAQNAIVSNKCAEFTIDQSSFDLNYRNIIVKPCGNEFTGTVHNTTFDCSNISSMLFPHDGERTYSAYEAEEVEMLYIGQPQSGLTDNTYSNLSSAIHLNKTSAVIQNNEFNNIQFVFGQPVMPAITVEGHSDHTFSQPYHLQIGGTHPDEANVFANCRKGINLTYGLTSYIGKNRFTNTGEAIYFAFCSWDAKTFVIDNRITNSETGIYGYRNNLSKNEISNNTIKWTGNAMPGTGIKVESVLSLSEYYAIEFNNITKARIGIFTNSTTKSLIKENDITFVSGAQVLPSYGIRITGGEKMEVYGNSITGPAQAQNFSRGISISMCTKSDVQCNSVDKCEHGLNFEGETPSTVYRNSMKKNYYGVTFTGGGYISPQGSMTYPCDNTWKQNYRDGYSFYSFAHQSPFFVRSNLPIPGNVAPYIPYFDLTFVTPPGPPHYTAPVCTLNASGTIVACQLSASGNPFQAGFMRKIAKNQLDYSQFPQSESWEAKKDVYGILKSDTLQIYQGDTVLTSFADSMFLSPVEKIMLSTDLYSADSIASAQLLNNSLTVSTLPEQHLKAVNNIAFRDNEVAISYSVSEVQYLQFIASQCPYEYGPAVFVARALLSPVDTTFYTNSCEIISDSVSNRSMENKIHQDVDHVTELILNPNPASEQFEVLVVSKNNENWNWKILSIDGSTIFNSGIVTANENKQISISNLENGVYLFTVFNGNNTLTKRLIILK